MATEHQERVNLFMLNAGQEVPTDIHIPPRAIRYLRAKLILEEALETINALGFDISQQRAVGTEPIRHIKLTDRKEGPNLEEVIDGCCDLRVVATGTLTAFGVSDSEVQEAIDISNLEKFDTLPCQNCGYTSWEPNLKMQMAECIKCGTPEPLDNIGGYRRADGKWVKPKWWQAPDLLSIARPNRPKDRGQDQTP